MTRTPEALAPPPADPPRTVQPGYPVLGHTEFPLPTAPRIIHLGPPLGFSARYSVFSLARVACGAALDSVRYLLSTRRDAYRRT